MDSIPQLYFTLLETTLAANATLSRTARDYRRRTPLYNPFCLNVYADSFYKCANIFHAFLARVPAEMFPAAGFEEQAGAQVGQGLGKRCLFPINVAAQVGQFTTFLERAPVLIAIKRKCKRLDIFPARAA